MKATEFQTEHPIRLLREQDGGAERLLKAQLVERFSGRADVQRAYLVLGELAPDQATVFLAIASVSPSKVIADAAGEEFSRLFRSNEHLDVVFVSEEQERALAGVAVPFFSQSII